MLMGAIQAAAQATAGGAARPAVTAKMEEAAAKAANDNPNYVIGPSDDLDINVWKEPDISRKVPVRPDGKISLPLINDIQAAGLTPMQLKAQITEKLKKFLTDPQVTVIVMNINSQRVYIMGETNRPGAYPLLPNMTILQALTSAGGFSQFANTSKIQLLRTENGKQKTYFFNYKEVVQGKNTDQNLVLKPGDSIVIP
jgi:polysaccharide export outer membrane protein